MADAEVVVASSVTKTPPEAPEPEVPTIVVETSASTDTGPAEATAVVVTEVDPPSVDPPSAAVPPSVDPSPAAAPPSADPTPAADPPPSNIEPPAQKAPPPTPVVNGSINDDDIPVHYATNAYSPTLNRKYNDSLDESEFMSKYKAYSKPYVQDSYEPDDHYRYRYKSPYNRAEVAEVLAYSADNDYSSRLIRRALGHDEGDIRTVHERILSHPVLEPRPCPTFSSRISRESRNVLKKGYEFDPELPRLRAAYEVITETEMPLF